MIGWISLVFFGSFGSLEKGLLLAPQRVLTVTSSRYLGKTSSFDTKEGILSRMKKCKELICAWEKMWLLKKTSKSCAQRTFRHHRLVFRTSATSGFRLVSCFTAFTSVASPKQQYKQHHNPMSARKTSSNEEIKKWIEEFLTQFLETGGQLKKSTIRKYVEEKQGFKFSKADKKGRFKTLLNEFIKPPFLFFSISQKTHPNNPT